MIDELLDPEVLAQRFRTKHRKFAWKVAMSAVLFVIFAESAAYLDSLRSAIWIRTHASEYATLTHALGLPGSASFEATQWSIVAVALLMAVRFALYAIKWTKLARLQVKVLREH